jgi:hypothetical protein
MSLSKSEIFSHVIEPVERFLFYNGRHYNLKDVNSKNIRNYDAEYN